MPELQEDEGALGVDGINDLAPTFDLLVRPDAGHAGIAEGSRRDRRGLGNDQPALRGALRIIFGVERPRCVRRF
jgi:hypothetical protein